MSILTNDFWESAVSAAKASVPLKRKSDHLVGYIFEFDIDEASFFFEFHRGTVNQLPRVPLTGLKGRVHGPLQEWLRVVNGEIPFIRGVNGLHGRLRFEGSALENTWASPALGEFLSIAASVNKGKTHD